ncbi:MAG: DUF4144 family protein [Gammaproteobacteria bacterium]
MNATSPSWPAIIKHAGDDELSYISSETAWLADPYISAHPCNDDDILIDSRGYIFNLHYDTRRKQVYLLHTGAVMPLGRFSTMVQMHLAVLEQCCISKLTFIDYSHGIRLVAASDDS